MNAKRGGVPVRSMTGFSRVSFGGHGVELEVEARSVNHRFLDVVVKAPRCYAPFERDLKGLLQKLHKRGRIELSVSRRRVVPDEADVTIPESVDRYVQLYGAACRRYGVSPDTLGDFLGNVILREGSSGDDSDEVREDEVAVLLRLVDEASEALAVMRESEGASLVVEISGRMERLQAIVVQIRERSATSPAKLRERVLERVRALSPEVVVDEQRLAQEVAFLCDRVDIAEELARLMIHLESFTEILRGHPDGVGRKLDFMTQEVARELNTIGSKAQDASIQGLVVEAKAELERAREQVQNIE